MKRRKTKTKTVPVQIVGPILHQVHGGFLWKLRLKAPRFPFFLDSILCFQTKEEAERAEKKWRGRKVVIRINE